MDQSSTPDYEFRGYRLDTTLQVLTSPVGLPIALPSRAFEALRYLVERAGELVDKGALMRAVWPNVVVEENNLSQCILALRKALGENAGDRKFILTVPGRGFKFVAPVTVWPHDPSRAATTLPTTPPADPEITQPAQPTGRAVPPISPARSWGRFAMPAIPAIAVALAVLLINSHRHGALTSPAEYQALTGVADAATDPALSPDGRMLAFVRGGGDGFARTGQIWLRVLPDGEPVQLTHVTGEIFAPTFTPDGSHIAFSLISQTSLGGDWDTYTIPITGGEPARLLPNATGLTFVGAHEVLYSEFKVGTHLGIVVSQEDRSRHREVYYPSHVRGMAHFSHLSPDRREVLVVEMDRAAKFRQCRLVPFDGSSPGIPVGPVGSCRYAAWSPDGAWMYFSVVNDGHSHLWRQRLGAGQPEQITFGPTDEVGVAVTPDGHALLTSVGLSQSTIWLHDNSGERVLTTESDAWLPWLSDDARRVYFLAARSPAESSVLWRMDVASGRKEPILTGYALTGYDISYDEQQVVFTVTQGSTSEIWIAPLDRHTAPKLLRRGADEAVFDRHGRVFFRSYGEHANFLHRMAADGSAEQQVLAGPILEFRAVTPEGDRATADLPVKTGIGQATLVSLNGGMPWAVAKGWAPARWSRDGRRLYVDVGMMTSAESTGRTAVLSTGADGLPAGPVAQLLPDATMIPHNEELISVGSEPSTYVFVRSARQRNIYRLPLH